MGELHGLSINKINSHLCLIFILEVRKGGKRMKMEEGGGGEGSVDRVVETVPDYPLAITSSSQGEKNSIYTTVIMYNG